MKASEKDIANLDNDYLASVLEKQIATDKCKCFVCNCVNEAAARLLKMDALDMALNIEVGMNKAAAEITVALRRRLKVAEDALEKLQDRLVSSVHDGTIDPHEALEIAENSLAAIREEGCDPCNAKDGEGSSLRIGWEGEKEYCVVAKYRQDLQVELEDYDYHRVTGPLPLDIAKHWLDYHKRIRTKSEDPKILVREVSKWRLFDQVEEGETVK